MDMFNLPVTARVDRVIPKNSFDRLATPAQRRDFSELVQRITWLYKLSTDTINLDGESIKEIQVFRIELKVKKSIDNLLTLIDKSIPYTIIFSIEFGDWVYILTSIKHSSPLDENRSVIDWTIKTEWFLRTENHFIFNLRKSLDEVYLDICTQLKGGKVSEKNTIKGMAEVGREIDSLRNRIAKLRSAIASCKQFNRKVEMNIQLKEMEVLLHRLL